MAKAPTSCTGLDFGTHTVKAVSLSRQGGKIILNGYAARDIGEGIRDEDELVHHLKLLLSDLGSNSKAVSAAISEDDAILRIIDQPPTPVEIMRSGLKLNGRALLHEECSGYVLDCDIIPEETSEEHGRSRQQKFLVGGLRKSRIEMFTSGFSKLKLPVQRMQLSPIALFNAFEFARPEVVTSSSFILADVGHKQTTVIGGNRGAVLMIRTIPYGGHHLISDLTLNDAIDRDSALLLVDQGDAGMADAARHSLQTVARELISSIGFFEGQRDLNIPSLFVSGGCSRAEMILQVLSDEINLPCEAWDPLDRVQLAMSQDKKDHIQAEARQLNAAFGVAIEQILPA